MESFNVADENGGFVPTYLKTLIQLGTVGAIAVYMVWFQTQTLNANMVTLTAQSQAIQSALAQHIIATEALVVEVRRANLILLQSCSQAAKSDSGVRACWNAAAAVGK